MEDGFFHFALRAPNSALGLAGAGVEPALFAVALLSLKLTLSSARLCNSMMAADGKRFKGKSGSKRIAGC